MADVRGILTEIDQSTDWSGIRKLGYALAPSLLPTAGAAVMTPFLGPMAGPIVGGIAGEAGNNIIGLTNPSVGGYLAQVMVPPMLRAGKLLPGFGTAQRARNTLQDVGKRDLQMIQERYQPPIPSRDLFDRVGEEIIHMPQAKDAAKNVLDRIAKEYASDQPLYKQSKAAADEVINVFKPSRVIHPLSAHHTLNVRPGAGGLEADRFQNALSTLGQRLRAARKGEEKVGGSANVRNYSELYGGYARDLDASPILKEAREAFKREQVLEDVWDKAKIFTPKGHGEAQQINVNRLMDRLKNEEDELGRFFYQAFTAREQQEILKRLGKINDLPGMGPGTGQAVGSSKVNPVLAAMLGIGGLGTMHGATQGGVGVGIGEGLLAAGATYGLTGAARMMRDLSVAWNIPAGRALITEMLNKSGGVMTPQIRSAVEGFVASQVAKTPRTIEILKR